MLNDVCQDVTLTQDRLTMAEEEKEKAEAGHDISASAFLLMGMDIQNLQCVYLSSM